MQQELVSLPTSYFCLRVLEKWRQQPDVRKDEEVELHVKLLHSFASCILTVL